MYLCHLIFNLLLLIGPYHSCPLSCIFWTECYFVIFNIHEEFSSPFPYDVFLYLYIVQLSRPSYLSFLLSGNLLSQPNPVLSVVANSHSTWMATMGSCCRSNSLMLPWGSLFNFQTHPQLGIISVLAQLLQSFWTTCNCPPLFHSSILDTFRPERLIFQHYIF